MVKRKKTMNTENDYKMFVARCNPSEDFILPTLEELNQNGIAIIHNVNGGNVVDRQMYGAHDGPDLDENLTRKFLSVCKEIYSIEKIRCAHPISLELAIGNKIRYVDSRSK